MRHVLAPLIALLLSVPGAASEITRDSVLAAMNAYRARHGASALRADSRLEAAAEDRIRDMEELAYWAHQAPDGRAPFVWLRPHGYEYVFAGENLASGFETTDLLVQSWMESPGHRENILSSNYDDCGIAIIDGATTGRAAGKSIVVLFGRARIPRVASVAKK